MTRFTLMVVLLVSVVISCNKKEIITDSPPYIDQWWDKYYGSYTVYDTVSGLSYQMEVAQISRTFQDNIFYDSIFINNYSNLFDFSLTLNGYAYSNALSLGSYFPKVDHNNLQWAFSGGMIWNENMDTLEVHSTISNIAFYMEDGVPFYDCNCIDLAVKNP